MGYPFHVLALTLNATANVLLKIGATHLAGPGEPGWLGRLVTDHYLLAGVILFALNVAFYVAALARLNLSVAYPIMVAGGVIVVVIAGSVLVLREAMTPPRVAGLLLPILGVVLVANRPVA